ncbi:MAG TPA: septal ring lytic transglycosylase RlpA family protein [Flavisolibacter sp.]|jgi:rare lipoprotein A|nr:septal ring lytic transglycosylase RlpA family protein [Flavisolibacter sp.]
MRICLLFISIFFSLSAGTQIPSVPETEGMQDTPLLETENKARTYFGVASYYADKFNGRKTATGAIYDHSKLTAACNVLALGTWIQITNLRNNKKIIVQVNDRLHPKNKRIVDLSRLAAEKLGYLKRGLTQVRVDVLVRKKN